MRYSVLMELPYFDPCSFVAVDTMHNLYLGTGKHVFTTWVETGTLTSQDLLIIEKRIKSFFIPVDVGRLPSNMKSSYKGFTANQWKNWITIYSLVILKDLLSPEHLQCWQFFVRSCIILCSYCIHSSDFNAPSAILPPISNLYGNSRCTFNMHLHLHLKQTYLDFGPPHATWCYVFERFNGVLGSYFTNNKTIEPQIMRKFTQHQMILSSDCAENADTDIFQFHIQQQNKVEGMGNTLYLLHFTTTPLSKLSSFAVTDDDVNAISPLPPLFEEIMTAEQVNYLQVIYKQIYPLKTIKTLSATMHKFGRLLLAGDLIGSNMPGRNSRASSVIMAYWPVT